MAIGLKVSYPPRDRLNTIVLLVVVVIFYALTNIGLYLSFPVQKSSYENWPPVSPNLTRQSQSHNHINILHNA